MYINLKPLKHSLRSSLNVDIVSSSEVLGLMNPEVLLMPNARMEINCQSSESSIFIFNLWKKKNVNMYVVSQWAIIILKTCINLSLVYRGISKGYLTILMF